MSRRRAVKQDSLELLLDTICNTFGGVLFIAILVVLLLQQTGKAPASTATSPQKLSAIEFQTLVTRLEIADAELSRVRQNRESQEAIVESFAPAEVRQLLESRNEVEKWQEALQIEVDQLLASNASLFAEIEQIQVDNSSVRTKLKEAKTHLDQAQTQMQQARQSRIQEIRLPVVRDTVGKTEISLILRYGRLYVWHKYSFGSIREGLNTDDFAVVEERAGCLVTHPIPTAGIPLNASPESRAAIRTVLRQFDPKSVYLAVVVRPDSYDSFQHVRDVALEMRFEYRLMPSSADLPIMDRGGSGGRVQ